MVKTHSIHKTIVALLVLASSFRPTAATVQTPSVVVSYRAPSSFVVHEPVLVMFTIDNQMSEPISFDVGYNRIASFAVSVTRPDGTVVQPPAPLPKNGVLRHGRFSLGAGTVYSQQLLLTEWLPLELPGLYQVQLALTTPIRTRGSVLNVSSAGVVRFNIVERDEGRLNETCRRLADVVTGSQVSEEYLDAARALSYVNDPLGVRYMRAVLMKTDRVDSIILEGLSRINTPDARAVLAEMAQGQDSDRSSIARSMLLMSSRKK